jgi:ParB/RepB/Spo0J family partition protein
MMTDFKMVPVKDIHPDPNQPRKFYDHQAMQELTVSIKEKGVLQPILIRPNEKGYVLVCGERRFRASKAAGLNEIPAVVRILSDDEALELQIIENLQRKDVHPMEEAVAFKSMMEHKSRPYSVADISAKVGKAESYISQRLSLNNLIPELQKEFFAGKFLVGHAALFSRLSPEDQKICQKDCKDWDREYKTIKGVQDFISRNIMRVLSSAPFKKDDPTLNPEMGACSSCPFKSGNNPSLFGDIKEDDRCFKPACFTKKIEAYTIRKVESILTEEPEIRLLRNMHDKVLSPIANKAKEFNVVILKEYDDFSSYGNGPGLNGFWINGDNIGKTEKIYLRKSLSSSTGDKTHKTSIDEEIAGIRQRTKRAAELDDEKVWKKIHEEIIKDKALIHGSSLSKVDTAALLMAMYEKSGYSDNDKIAKVFGGGTKKLLVEKMLKASVQQFNEASRIFINTVLDSAVSSHTASPGQGLLKMVAEQYHKDKIARIELEQKEKRTKRELSANHRIKVMQDQKKVLKDQKKKPAEKKSPVKKTVVKAGYPKPKKAAKKTK